MTHLESAAEFGGNSATVIHHTNVGDIEETGPTGILADHATEFFWRHLSVCQGDRAAEAGCGTGFLSMYCALSGAMYVTGTDIDAVAIEAARANAKRNGIANVSFVQGNLLEPVSGPLDLVVGLLPHKPAPRAFNHRYFGGADGTDLLLAVIEQAAERLISGGRLVLYINSIANTPRVMKAFCRNFEIRLIAEKQRPFTREEFDSLTPGMFDYLTEQRALRQAEFFDEGGKMYFLARLYQGVRR